VQPTASASQGLGSLGGGLIQAAIATCHSRGATPDRAANLQVCL